MISLLVLFAIAIGLIVVVAAVSLHYGVQQKKNKLVPEQTSQASNQQIPICPYCGQPLYWVPQYERYFCRKEQRLI